MQVTVARWRTAANALAQRRWFWPVIVVLLALLPRLVMWSVSTHPGMWDPTEYYNLAVNLHAGDGFTLDYIWSFANDPAGVTHPLDHWLPLPGVLAAGSFVVFGVSVRAALLPFVLLGGLQSMLVYGFARRIGVSRAAAVFAALATAWTPWLFLSSLHTDTTTLFGVLGFGALGAVYLGVTEDGRWLWLAGLLTGLAMLTRNDAVMLIVAGVLGGVWIAWRRGSHHVRAAHVFGAFALIVLVMLPWMLRNQSALGSPWPGSTAQSLFVTDHEDFYAYSKEISLARYLDQGIATIAAKIAFELAASVKLMITLVELVFPVAIIAGLLEAVAPVRHADGQRRDLLPYAPAFAFILLTFGAYGVLMPYLSQGGSFKKAYLAMVPFLLIFGAQTIERTVRPRSAYYLVSAITLALLLANAVELTRADFRYNRDQAAIYTDLGGVLDALQADEAREVILMTRDPWSVNYVTGYRAVMVPNEPLDVILTVADRYGVTHIMAPASRAALDGGSITHPRLERAAVQPASGFRLYRIAPLADN